MKRVAQAFEKINKMDFLHKPSIHIRSKHGRCLAVSGNGLRYELEQSDNFNILKNILIKVEDHRFMSHGPVDIYGIIRAIVKNITSGRIVQGGSTLTQQLARTLFLSQSRTWSRKICEIIISFKLEKKFTKEQILDYYCNHVYMGKGCYGFETASKIIYRKSFRNLDQSQVISLVGLLGSPEKFHPLRNEAIFWYRANHIAKLLGVTAIKTPINPIVLSKNKFKRFTYVAEKKLLNLGIPLEEISAVELTIDEVLQKSIDRTLEKFSLYKGINGIAAVIICNKSGDLLAESAWRKGSATEFSPSFDGLIQPGSTFKTFALLAAIEDGISLDTQFESNPYFSDNWNVRNYGHQYYGKISLNDAFIKSDNTVFSRLTEILSEDKLAAIYERFNLIEKSFFTKSAVLGGIKKGVSLINLANAYATIARNGVMIQPRFIRYIEFKDNTFIHIPQQQEKVMLSYEAVIKIKNSLSLSGFKSNAHVFSGKSGTTKKGSVFCGYTEEISVALWVDYEKEQSETTPKTLGAIKVIDAFLKEGIGLLSKAKLRIE